MSLMGACYQLWPGILSRETFVLSHECSEAPRRHEVLLSELLVTMQQMSGSLLSFLTAEKSCLIKIDKTDYHLLLLNVPTKVVPSCLLVEKELSGALVIVLLKFSFPPSWLVVFSFC